ncbi:MAG: hypothetical protein ACYTAF_03270 [Planctomycetota bacterium]|jgi:hypothetical protein
MMRTSVIAVLLAVVCALCACSSTPEQVFYDEDGPYSWMLLGRFVKEFPPDDAWKDRGRFDAEFILLLNPMNWEDTIDVREIVARQKDRLRAIVRDEIILPRTRADFQGTYILHHIAGEIETRLNRELGTGPSGQWMIRDVTYRNVLSIPAP